MSKINYIEGIGMKKHLCLCKCNSIEHQAVFTYFTDDNDEKEVYLSVHLSKLGFWQRLIHGVKYIFGHRSMYGDFEEFIFKPEDWKTLNTVSKYLKSCIEGK